jgi:hypothetical protein
MVNFFLYKLWQISVYRINLRESGKRPTYRGKEFKRGIGNS